MEKRYCKKCGRPLDRGDIDLCRGCIELAEKGQTYEEYQEEHKTEECYTNNKVALAIKIIAIIGAVLGIIYGCTLFDSAYTEELGVIYIVVSIISAVFVYALGEAIQKLQNIEDNTRMK